jgi:hypothetical protein
MAILNSFVNDIFERIATEASSTYCVGLEITRFNLLFVLRTRVILQKIYHLITRDSNRGPTDLTW